MEYYTKDAQATQELGRKIGSSLKGGEVIALIGELGAGKTTFVQGLGQGLGIDARIISPTFILMRSYKANKELNLHHIDLYRLEDNILEELENMGITEVWNRNEDIVVIEWAEKAKDFLPKDTMYISIKEKDGGRSIEML